MTFYKLNEICTLLWGKYWKRELSLCLGIDSKTVNEWKTKGVPDWVNPEMRKIIKDRISEVLIAKIKLTGIG